MTTITSDSPPANAAVRTGWLIATLLLGLGIAFGAAMSAREGTIVYQGPDGGTLQPSAVPSPVQAAESGPPAAPLVRGDQLTYVLVDSDEAATAFQAFVDTSKRTTQRLFGEAEIVVLSTSEQDEAALRELIASATLELMAWGAAVEVLDLRVP